MEVSLHQEHILHSAVAGTRSNDAMREVLVRQNTYPNQVVVLHEWAVASILEAHALVHDHAVHDHVRAYVHVHVLEAEAFSHFLPTVVVDIHILNAEVECKVVQKVGVVVANAAALAFDFQEAVEDEKVMLQP